MANLRLAVKTFWNDEEGATAIEYGLIAALIAVVIVAGATLVGTQLDCIFRYIASCLTAGGCPAAMTC